MIKRMIIMIVLIGGVFGYVFYQRISDDKQTKAFLSSMKAPPVTVSTMEVKETSWNPTLSAVGSLVPDSGVDVTGEVPGIISQIHFKSGQVVNKGDLLITLDFRADQAQLKSLMASEELARLQLERRQKLVKKKMTPQSELDKAEAEFKKIQAMVDNQKIMIDKKQIKAPFSGVLGIRKVDLGQYLSPGLSIVSLQAIDPIYVDFAMPQQRLKDLYSGQNIEFTVDSWEGMRFLGKITAIEPSIDSLSRNFNLRATLDNNEKKLRPGMFGNVSITLTETQMAITLPQTAISYNPYGDIIFIAEETGKNEQGLAIVTARRRFVVLGEHRGDQVAVKKGLQPGEQVVIMGHHKVRDGSLLIINNQILPDNNPAPNLIDE
jgi:membrane fusion protein (multidrug efflux system)